MLVSLPLDSARTWWPVSSSTSGEVWASASKAAGNGHSLIDVISTEEVVGTVLVCPLGSVLVCSMASALVCPMGSVFVSTIGQYLNLIGSICSFPVCHMGSVIMYPFGSVLVCLMCSGPYCQI